MPVEIFCCYARRDLQLLDELKTHLIPLKRQGFITIWNDTDISPGTNWEEEINKHLDTAHIILLLISPSFMASDYCYSKEMRRAIERHKRGEARVIPIILRPVYWQGESFGKLQVLPVDAKPVRSWPDLDEAFFNVAEGIREVVELLLSRMKDPQFIYIQATNGEPVLDDPLNSQSASDWKEGDWNDSSFFFSEGALHITVKKNEIYAASMANETHFTDFAFQANMTLIAGDGGGIVFRSGIEVAGGYRFFVGRDYSDLVCAHKQLFIDKNIKVFLNKACTLTVVAKGSDIFLYKDGHCVAQVQDNSASSGKIGLLATNFKRDTLVQFRNVKVWNLT